MCLFWKVITLSFVCMCVLWLQLTTQETLCLLDLHTFGIVRWVHNCLLPPQMAWWAAVRLYFCLTEDCYFLWIVGQKLEKLHWPELTHPAGHVIWHFAVGKLWRRELRSVSNAGVWNRKQHLQHVTIIRWRWRKRGSEVTGSMFRTLPVDLG